MLLYGARAQQPNTEVLAVLCARVLVPRGNVIEMEPERRRGPRYLFVADTEVTDMPSGPKRSARTSELSISGCFIDTHDPAAAGTHLRIRISQRNTTFTAFGCVISVIPNTGMSIAFTNIELNQVSILEKWLPAAI
jgi:hypothetical protein